MSENGTERGYSLARRFPDGAVRRGALSRVMEDWREEERWLFFSPHDDDLAIGGGLLMAIASAEGVSQRARIVTDGRMGYTSVTGADEIVRVRQEETAASFQVLGVEDYAWYGYPDSQLHLHLGRRAAAQGGQGDPHGVAGFCGLQNSCTAELRSFRPTRVFIMSSADYHPDHKLVHQEVLISLFHAGGDIWPELGPPLEETPRVYEIAAYCPFVEAPDLEIRAGAALFEKKISSIEAFASQAQIAHLVEGLRRGGPVEYVRTFPFTFYDSRRYEALFSPEGG
nr:PIG-L family deacetylase [Alkalispirochaeta alkalica]